MDYAGWVTTITSLLEYQVTDAASAAPTNVDSFNAVIPAAIDYTENRMQRDLDFIATTVTAANGVMTPNSRLLTLPSVDIPAPSQIPQLLGTPIAPNSIITTTNGSMIANVEWNAYSLSAGEDVSLLLPLKVGGLTLGGVYQIQTAVDANNFTINMGFAATFDDSAAVIGNGIYIVCTQIRPIVSGRKLQPLEPVTRDYLDFSWPEDESPGAGILPVQWCPNDQVTVLVGPAPDQAYGFEAVGTMRVPQLSSLNVSNFLTQQFPDLYVAASMVFLSGYQANYGTSANDPGMAQFWEGEYQKLLGSSVVEETRKRFANMSPSATNPAAAPAKNG